MREVQCEVEAEFRGIFRMDIASLESLFNTAWNLEISGDEN